MYEIRVILIQKCVALKINREKKLYLKSIKFITKKHQCYLQKEIENENEIG